MNYTKIYADLCLSRMLMDRKRDNTYYENHHYLPESLGGPDTPHNMVLLTPREHYIAHFLLYKIYKQKNMKTEMHKMAYAFNMMTISNDNQSRYNSHTYSIARKAVSEAKKGKAPWNKGKTNIYSDETLKRISETSKGRQYQLGLKRTNETKRKIGEKSKDRGKTVLQYDLKGNFIAEHITAKKAGENTGKNSTSIIKCCNGQIRKYSGYIWRYKKGYIRKKIKGVTEIIKKPVIQMDLDGNFIAEFESINEAKRATGASEINRCCKKNSHYKSSGGFKWKYKD